MLPQLKATKFHWANYAAEFDFKRVFIVVLNDLMQVVWHGTGQKATLQPVEPRAHTSIDSPDVVIRSQA